MNDPIDNWLDADPHRYAKVFRANRRWYVSLYVWPRTEAAVGQGASLDEAFSDALNDIMRREGAHAEEGHEEG